VVAVAAVVLVAAARMTAMTDSSAVIAGYWDAVSSSFDDEPDHGLRDELTRAAWARRLTGWVPDGPVDVLDVGCGTGSLSLLLARAGHRVTGVDLAPRMVALAQAKLAGAGVVGRFLVGDAAAPPVGDQRFDVVLSRHLVWTLPDPEAALRQWVGLLRPGGHLVLIEGLWRRPGQSEEAYAGAVGGLPWDGGIGAGRLSAAIRPLVADVRVEPLSGDEALWGRPVDDERYALIAWA
jgi:SAM-dependent methyltransferase